MNNTVLLEKTEVNFATSVKKLDSSSTKSIYKVGVTFFPLTNKEWVIMSKKLPPSRLKVFYYLRSFSGPYEKPIRLSVNRIAEELGLNRCTVSRCLRDLNAEGLINLNKTDLQADILMPAWQFSTNALQGHMITIDDQADHRCDQNDHNDHTAGSDDHVCDRTVTSDIYIDPAREDLKDLDPPPTPSSENLEGGGNFEKKEELEKLVASLQDQIRELREAIGAGMGNFSATATHQGNVSATATGHQGSVVGMQVSGHEGDISANAEGHQGCVIGNGSAGHSGNIAAHASGHTGDVISTFPPDVVEHIPLPILKRIVDLGIPLDNQVIALLKEVDVSQINGALNHIEETFDTIKSPKAILLHKAPKMPVEKKLLHPVFRAEDQPKIEKADPPSHIKQQLDQMLARIKASSEAEKIKQRQARNR